jgi:hypothetical protein
VSAAHRSATPRTAAERRAARARHVDDRSIRQQQVGLALMLFCLALLAPLGQMFGLWPIVSVGGVVSGLLLWGALRDESIAGPVVGLVLTNLSGMFVGDGPALGPLAGVVLAIALGEHLSMMQHSRYATPGHAVRWSGSGPVAVHAIVAAAAMAVTIGAARLPDDRAWSIAVIVAFAIVGIVAGRRRASLPTDR